jgi:hypothetical protein
MTRKSFRGCYGKSKIEPFAVYLTGLGSALWVLDRFPGEDQIVRNALFQYLDYYFTDLKS